jgi:hypothetical protein
MRFEYLVCLAQQGRVTWVNEKWIGGRSPDEGEAAIHSCPRISEFLNQKGSEGWELTTVSAEIAKGEIAGFFSDQLEITRFMTLFLKRLITA